MAATAAAKKRTTTSKAKAKTTAPAEKKPGKKTKIATSLEEAYLKGYTSGYKDRGEIPKMIGTSPAAVIGYTKGVSDRKKADKLDKRQSRAKK